MSYIAEQQVIGSLLMDTNCMSDIYSSLTPDMFTSELLGRIYHEFQRGFDNRYTINIAVIEQKLRDEGYSSDIVLSELKECMSNTFTSAEVKSNANVVVSDYKARRLDKFLSAIKVTPNNFKSIITSLTQEIEQLQDKRHVKSKTLSEITVKYKDEYFKDKTVTPLYLGFPKLDDLLGGLEGGDMIVIGARPAVGKSAFVTQITSHLGKLGKRIGFYNLEMQDKQMYERFMVNESGLSLTRLKRATRFLGDEKERFDKANENLQKANNIIITSTGSKTVNEIRAESRNMDYDIIVIDYLQLLSAETTYRGNRAAEVGEISRNIKNLAMELNIPIIALSQLNRVSEGKETKEPTMAELREAGNIEQDASVIILLWNLNPEDKSKKGCKIEKQRQGENGKVVLEFNGDLMRFEETNETVKSASEWSKTDTDNPFG